MKNATVYNEAALSEGSERFYRGAKAGEATPSKGLVFSRDRADAAAYAAKIGGELSYVDVPKNRVAELKPAAHKPDARVIVSAEMAQGRRVAEPAQMAQAAPRQRRRRRPRSRRRRNIGKRRASQVPSASITAASRTSNPPRKEWCSRGTPPTPGDMRSRPEVSSPTSMWRRSACRKFSRRRRRRRHGWS